MVNNDHKVEIIEQYHNYIPPFPVKEIVAARLSGISAHFLQGLGTIVLTNYGGLNHQRRRQKTQVQNHKIAVADCGGLYFCKRHGDAATIELFIDNIIRHGGHPWLLKVRFFRGMIIGKTLVHEIGHHIQATPIPEHNQSGEIAEEWRRRLTREYGRRRYWYLRPLNPLFKLLVPALRAMAKEPLKVDVSKQHSRKQS